MKAYAAAKEVLPAECRSYLRFKFAEVLKQARDELVREQAEQGRRLLAAASPVFVSETVVRPDIKGGLVAGHEQRRGPAGDAQACAGGALAGRVACGGA